MKSVSFVMARARAASILAFVVTMASGCSSASDPAEPVGDTSATPDFEQFEAKVLKDEDGIYIIDGDTPVDDVKKLREVYQSSYSPNRLVVMQWGDGDAAWTSAQKRQLSYCVSDSFGGYKARVVQAMAEATLEWSRAADVRYVYVPAEDARCNASNTNVLFDVRPTRDEEFLARAFFPGQQRSSRNILVSHTSFQGGSISLTGILRHELGHTLGFRHEHTRPEANANECYEDDDWRALTGYDRRSVMHYPQCNGRDTGLEITARDAQGAQALYGAPGFSPPPPSGEDTKETASGTVAQGATDAFEPLTATTHVKAVLSGTGDADLYLRFGSAPSEGQYHCRPFLSGADEICELDVPAGQSKVFLSVVGYTASSYTLEVTYR